MGVLCLLLIAGPALALGGDCPESLHGIYADMHDGDKKEVTIDGSSMIIKPSGNNETWTVKATFNNELCSAIVDFNVPGKPSPPPVKITLTLWHALGSSREGDAVSKTTFEFTDPSGKLAPASFPLNKWVELEMHPDKPGPGCGDFQAVYADMHDGDKKKVSIKGNAMVIEPFDNKQAWIVNAKLDEFCSADVDFRVPGKPSPPPVDLKLTLWSLWAIQGQKFDQKTSFEFTDPSGKLASPDYPLNQWVELSEKADLIVV